MTGVRRVLFRSGVWSYGRKWNPEGSVFDIMNIRWGDTGWYLGNWGHGAPSIIAGPQLWAKDNSNGIPVVRWTCPISGYYNFNSTFFSFDYRGNDVGTYVTLNNSLLFNDKIEANADSTEYTMDCFYVSENDYIDFLVAWDHDFYSETGWTHVKVIISKYVDE